MPDLKNLSTDDLIALAMTTSMDDEDGYSDGWQAIRVLMQRGTRDVFEACRALIQSGDTNHRRVGVDVLGQLGYSDQYPFARETLPMLIELVGRDTDVNVLQAVAVALGHLHQSKGVRSLLKLKSHPDFSIRLAVTIGLCRYERQDAIKALIKLSNDAEKFIRDWATFGLGALIDRDTLEIREALYACLSDDYEEVRGEALVGLARRNDSRVFEPLLTELARITAEGLRWELPLDAAEALADPRLLPALLAYQASWEGEKDWLYKHLENAIVACTPASADDSSGDYDEG